ncbi:hypothetical protein G9A89_011763 [Geosiphon pyriformis]|nr:hypothetical protein G9A89_011763 [Geosiphon pyriformis]
MRPFRRVGAISKLTILLLNLRTGLGAAKLGPKVSKISLLFSTKQDNAGARYFLRENLPRIAYNNPELPIKVDKIPKKGIKPELIIEFENPDDTVTLDLSQRHGDEICRELLNITKAVPTMVLPYLNKANENEKQIPDENTSSKRDVPVLRKISQPIERNNIKRWVLNVRHLPQALTITASRASVGNPTLEFYLGDPGRFQICADICAKLEEEDIDKKENELFLHFVGSNMYLAYESKDGIKVQGDFDMYHLWHQNGYPTIESDYSGNIYIMIGVKRLKELLDEIERAHHAQHNLRRKVPVTIRLGWRDQCAFFIAQTPEESRVTLTQLEKVTVLTDREARGHIKYDAGHPHTVVKLPDHQVFSQQILSIANLYKHINLEANRKGELNIVGIGSAVVTTALHYHKLRFSSLPLTINHNVQSADHEFRKVTLGAKQFSKFLCNPRMGNYIEIIAGFLENRCLILQLRYSGREMDQTQWIIAHVYWPHSQLNFL